MTFDERHRRLAIAPMMELTDRHFRHLARLLTRHSLLYTEMLTSRAVLHGDRERLLGHDPLEAPVVLQLGGSDPAEMAEAARIGEAFGYSEINMNVGCPSDRVQAGRFGACLMAEPELVADCVRAMQEAVAIPVSVKCRLGIDRDDSYEALQQFVETVADAGCRYFVVHARKAWLDGLSPKENRLVPPLRYEYVYRVKQHFPELHITINGGIDDWPAITDHLRQVDGVMLGRQAYYHPSFLADADARLYPDLPDGVTRLSGRAPDESSSAPANRLPNVTGVAPALEAVARDYALYMQAQIEGGARTSSLSRHLVALFQDRPGARRWRRHLSEQASRTEDAVTLVDEALEFVVPDQARLERSWSSPVLSPKPALSPN